MGIDKQSTTNRDEKSLQNLINVFDDEFYWLSNGSDEIQYSENIFHVTGYRSGEINSLTDIICDEDIDLYREKILEFKNDETKKEISLEYRIERKNGKLRWIRECIKVFRNDNGSIIRLVGRVFDITERKTVENNLQENLLTFQNQNSAKDKFINILSHDLRSPFTSILGFSEIILKESALTEAERNEYLSYIYSSSEKLLQLINYLLDWSKLQSPKMELNARRLSIRELIYNSVSALTGTAVRKNIEIKVDINSNARIYGDERLLNIVITNLINNAIKYSKEESKIDIKALQFNDNLVEFIIKDEGIGIPEEIKNKMFKIENIFSTPGTKGERGTGFGLTLSKEIVEKHGGDFWFYSEGGNGCEFHFTLLSPSNTMLIVETDSEKRKSLSSFFEKTLDNFTIISYADPSDTINNLGKVFPSIIITSHEMPLMNGAQLIETIIEGKKRTDLKIVVLTNSVTEEIRNNYGKLGDVVFLNKLASNIKISEQVLGLIN